ncbi:hypothetical protein HYU09_04350 [Candidatus Woesearchaeota archaeon]|nr:hypothetical protein [Candidatus Woesearchaeota archaeon]
MYGKSYFIDDLVRYNSAPSNTNGLNYFVSKSENYHVSAENMPIEYSGQQSKPKIYSNSNYESDKPTKTYYFTPRIFLKPSRRETPIIHATEQVKELIEEAFQLMLGKNLPENIVINICNVGELSQIHSRFGEWSEGIQGFAVNGRKLKKIFVKNNHLDELMLTIGHEIGHIYTSCLSNNHDEEAKAFSFAIEWAKTIKANNIGNLAENIKDDLDFNPARNGLHDLAFFFVKKLMNNGLKPMEIHNNLVKKYISLFGFYN